MALADQSSTLLSGSPSEFKMSRISRRNITVATMTHSQNGSTRTRTNPSFASLSKTSSWTCGWCRWASTSPLHIENARQSENYVSGGEIEVDCCTPVTNASDFGLQHPFPHLGYFGKESSLSWAWILYEEVVLTHIYRHIFYMRLPELRKVQPCYSVDGWLLMWCQAGTFLALAQLLLFACELTNE